MTRQQHRWSKLNKNNKLTNYVAKNERIYSVCIHTLIEEPSCKCICRKNTCFRYGSQNFIIDPESQNEYLKWQI
jgi:hypothetical protein